MTEFIKGNEMNQRAILPCVLFPSAGENFTSALERIWKEALAGELLPADITELVEIYQKLILFRHLTEDQTSRLREALAFNSFNDEISCRWMVDFLYALHRGLKSNTPLLMMKPAERNKHYKKLEKHFTGFNKIICALDCQSAFQEFMTEVWRQNGQGLEGEMRSANLWPEWPRNERTPIQMYMANIPINSLVLVKEGLVKCRRRLDFYNELVKRPTKYKYKQIVIFYECVIEFLLEYYPQEDCRIHDVDVITLLANIFFTPDEPPVNGDEYTSRSTITHLHDCFKCAMEKQHS